MPAPADAPAGQPSAGTEALGDRRNARLYLAGLAASLIGNSAMSLVAGIWVKSLTGSSARAGLVSVCIYAASLLSPAAGLLVDRLRKKPWLLWVNLASAAMIASLLTVTGRGELWVIYAAMTGYGLSLILIGPAEDALFAWMLPVDLRRRMNGWRLGIQETGRLVAPLIGAGLFAVLGGGVVAALDAATFVIAALVVSQLRVSEPPPGQRGKWSTEVAGGLVQIRRTPALATIMLATALVMAVSGVGVAAQYSLVSALGQRPSFLGVLSAGLGLGSVAASALSSRMLARVGEPALALLGLANFIAGTLLRASGWLPAAVAGSLVLGFALPWMFLATINMAQRLTPASLQGRASAVVTFALFAPQAPTQAAGSLAITYLSYRQVYLGSVAAVAIIGVWLWLRIRRQSSPAPRPAQAMR